MGSLGSRASRIESSAHRNSRGFPLPWSPPKGWHSFEPLLGLRVPVTDVPRRQQALQRTSELAPKLLITHQRQLYDKL